MLLKLCQDVDLYLSEILDATFRTFDSSKAPSELICLSGAHVPLPHISTDNYSE